MAVHNVFGVMTERAALVLLVVVASGAAAFENDAPLGPPVTIEKIDGSRLQGRWLASDDSSVLAIRTGAGETSVPVDELASVSFGTTIAHSRRAPGSALFYLSGGGRVRGTLLGSDGAALLANTSLGDATRFAFDRIAAVELADRAFFHAAAVRFDEALADRLPGKDILITRDTDTAKTVRGRLESLDPEKGRFVLGDNPRSFQTDKIYGVVFAAGSSGAARFSTTFELRDDTRVSGDIKSIAVDHVVLATSLGFDAEIQLDRIHAIVGHSDRLVFLGDLTPTESKSEGRLHGDWPVAVDTNVAGGPLRIAGRSFDRGIGMHSKAKVTYALGGDYQTFIATIGLDDAVRPRGSVVFKVMGDGRELFDSGSVTGTDSPRDIRLDVTKVKSVTLLVGFGDQLDLADYANWGGARLIKPRGRRKN